MTGSHWPSLLVVRGRVTARERARWGMTSPPMRSSARPVVAGYVPRARSRPAREEESGGTESAVSHSIVPVVGRAPLGRGLLLESCGAPVDTFGAANVGVRCGSVNVVSRRAGDLVALVMRVAATFASKLSLHAAVRYTPPVSSPSPTRPLRSPPTTIADIAELTGVSVPTVSKVINGRSDVSAETRRRVEAAIREHGYRRSPGSRPRTPLLEVIFHELESEWALEIVRGVERVAGQHHLAVVLSEMQGRRTPGPRLDRGRARPPADRRDRGVLRPQRVDAGAARGRAASRSSSSTRPASRSTTRRRSARPTGTAA